MNPLARGLLCVLLTVAATQAVATSACRRSPATSAAVETIRQVMAQGRFIAYQPTSLQVSDGRLTQADPASIRADLEVLRPRFDGLITYGAIHGAEQIPDIAAQLGFKAVIMGVWDVGDPTALNNVIAAARRQPDIVVGVSLGNERIFAGEISHAELAAAIDEAHQLAPRIAIAASEPFHMFLQPQASELLGRLDLLLPIVHPVHQPWFRQAPVANAADFVGKVLDDLAAVYCGPLLVKETGIPTAPADKGFSATLQMGFYRALAKRVPADRSRAFAYFSAFDAPWRSHDVTPTAGSYPEEAHWGLYTEKRVAKPVIDLIPPLRSINP